MYSADSKSKVLKYYNRSKTSYRSLSQIFDVGKSTIHRWVNSIPTCKTDDKYDYDNYVKEYIDMYPMTRQKMIKKYLHEHHNIKISCSTICRRLKMLKISRKKVSKRKTLSCNNKETKENFINKVRNHNKTIYCLDETGFDIYNHPDYGYSKKGSKCYFDTKEKSRGRKLHGIFMISQEKIVNYKLYNDGINQDRFIDFMSETTIDGDILMDNYSVHHGKRVKDYLTEREVGTLYNVAYSPELNPIEEVFGVLKRNIKWNVIDNIKDLKKVIKNEVDRINNEVNIKNFYKHSFGI